MASNISSSYSSLMRMGGLASGLDTDSIVESLMKAERTRLVKLEQKRTLLTWKQDKYREMTTALRDFEAKWLSYVGAQKNMLSASAYSAYSASSSDTSCVSASALSGAAEGVVTVSQGKMATAAQVSGTAGLTSPLIGTVDISGPLTLAGKGFTLTVDGVEREIVFSQDYASGADMLTDLQAMLDQSFGAGRVSTEITVDGYLHIYDDNSTIQIGAPTTAADALADLGFTDGQSHRLDLSATLDSLSGVLGLTFDGDDELKFTINGEDITVGKDETLATLFSRVNNSDAGVTIRYDALNDAITLATRKTGSEQYISISNTGGNFFGGGSAVGIDNGTWYGVNAELLVGGQLVTSQTNTLVSEGVTYTLQRDFTAGETQTVTVSMDADAVYDNIVQFVEGYNDLVDTLQASLNEKRNYDYAPLTDEMKEEMSEAEIEKWENLAKSGMLRGDDILRGVADKMRSAMMAVVPGVESGDPDLYLSTIGITTGSYQENGKLHIDEAKLRAAIAADPDEVTQIFSANSDIAYSPTLDATQREERFNESGLAQRIHDVIEDYTTTFRNTSGRKGILLEKAGIADDITDTLNQMSSEIKQVDLRIASTNEYLKYKEDHYWRQFTALETAINRMNSQSIYLSSMFASE